MLGRERVAVIDHQPASHLEQVRRYMPANYDAAELDGRIVIAGCDVAGWTLDDYVIPRLASGLHFAVEIFGKDAALLYSRLIVRLAGESEEMRAELATNQEASR